jgi:hypothetical protein
MTAEDTIEDLILGAQIAVNGEWKQIRASPPFPDECPIPIQQHQPLRRLHRKLPEEGLIH